MSYHLDTFAKDNTLFRNIINTTAYQQLVLMDIIDNIPKEIHPYNDQFIYIVEGKAKIIINNKEIILKKGDSITIKAGKEHEIFNYSKNDLKLFTIYSPPLHVINK